MKEMRNNKGMTLVEIIVVFMVTSILLMIVGGMILSSIGFFHRETINDNNKYITDKIASLVRDKVLYATDVKVTKTKQGKGWEWFSIDENGHIYLNDEDLFPDDFYNYHKLEVSARVYQSNRMDIVFCLMKDDKQVYKTTTTINLVNIDGANIEAGSEVSNTGLGTEKVEITELTGYRIYFKTSVRDIIDGKDPVDPNPPVPPIEPEEPEIPLNPDAPEISGTPSDELNCKNGGNTKEWVTGNANSNYRKGDFIYYQNKWYRVIKGDVGNSSSPDKNSDGNYKCLQDDWANQSSYEDGDVVIYMNKNKKEYYLCTETYYYENNSKSEYVPTAKIFWKELTLKEYEAYKKEHQNDKYCYKGVCAIGKLYTVEKEKCYVAAVPSELTSLGSSTKLTNYKGKFEDHINENKKVYMNGDFVLYENELWKCIKDNLNTSIVPGNNANWKKVQELFYAGSAYEKNDVIKYGDNYFRCLITGAYSSPQINAEWEMVQPNASDDGWISAN